MGLVVKLWLTGVIILVHSAREFINHDEIMETMEWADANRNNAELIAEVMGKADEMKGINHREAALLLVSGEAAELFALASRIKQKLYGNRGVLFAPLYLSNYCINGCVYCSYKTSNADMPRKRLSQDEICREVAALTAMGHTRIAIEAGEHPGNSIDYIMESIDTIYISGDIRRINVNIAATTVENYRKLKSANIGTYVLFQETYHEPTYTKVHPSGPKADYKWHTEAMDRAMQGGIDDVGIGVLFGLADYRYEFIALLMHSAHLEAAYGAGPHTISLPRLRNSNIHDDVFAKIVAAMRIAVPYTGIIISTRESEDMRQRLLDAGVTQISGGSCTSVGGYAHGGNSRQFEISDSRSLRQIVDWLMKHGHTPSFCTACYSEGRTGADFMDMCKSGLIQKHCEHNAKITLQEYLAKERVS